MRYLSVFLLMSLFLYAQEEKIKIVKKKAQEYNYQKYLDYLNNDKKPIGDYDYRYSFGAQISYDLGYVDQASDPFTNEPQPYFNNMFRRVRVDHAGSFFDKKLFYEFEYSLLQDEDRYKDVYIGYKDKLPFEKSAYRIKGGNIKIPFSLYRYTTSKNLSFMERPLGDDAFGMGRQLGVELFLHTKLQEHLFGVFLSGFTNSMDQRLEDEIAKSGNSLRLTYSYDIAKRELFHIGYGMMTHNYNNDDLGYKQDSESAILEEKYISTKIKNTNKIHYNNLDLLYINNKYSLQGGYTTSHVSADKGIYDFYSYFIEGSYFVLGRGKRFDLKESKFSKVKPKKDGAIELAFRYSYIDLNDKDELGGEQTNYNFALNYYLNKELKIMMNYIMAQPKGTDDYDGLLNIYQMRLLFAF